MVQWGADPSVRQRHPMIERGLFYGMSFFQFCEHIRHFQRRFDPADEIVVLSNGKVTVVNLAISRCIERSLGSNFYAANGRRRYSWTWDSLEGLAMACALGRELGKRLLDRWGKLTDVYHGGGRVEVWR